MGLAAIAGGHMRYKFMAFTNAMDGREEEFNDWYDRQHVPDVLSVPGFVSAQRFVAADAQMTSVQHKYMTIYEIETDDLAATLSAFGTRAAEGKIVMSDAVDRAGAAMSIYRPLGDPVERKES